VDSTAEGGAVEATSTVKVDPSIVSMVDAIPSTEPVVPVMRLSDVAVAFKGKTAVRDVSFEVGKNRVTSMIGPSGSGKTTLLRALNRLHDLTKGAVVSGEITLDGVDVYRGGIPTTILRTRIGMVFQRPNPFPTMSIYDNVASGLRFNGIRQRSILDDAVEHSLKAASLWDSVCRCRHPLGR
jgi:phosphate transport system ATP-binding protein